MALAGKAAGKDVGMRFGPAAVAAMRTLVDTFPACGLGVSVATDGTLFQLKSSPPRTRPRPARPSTPRTPTLPTRPATRWVVCGTKVWGYRIGLFLTHFTRCYYSS
ncbi:hypothetical protein B0H17DRAFT_1027886 [Mycena rosella]|uniref:Uncharacterized protein n=1 Tax=Mycena rosella TaxID=1033263 RepID=A0AAD7H3I9_MYCRO|nr:hypothetical protein B0H17DRAFT_1027886 [Mycena rosella]